MQFTTVELLKRGAYMKPGSQLCKVMVLFAIFTAAHLVVIPVQQKLQQIRDKGPGVSHSYRCLQFPVKCIPPIYDVFSGKGL
jgi:hypothetical protein